MNPDKSNFFFPHLKSESEKLWTSVEIDPKIHGFQIQKDTKWNSGLTAKEIELFEKDLGFSFPENYRNFLNHMNGTDKAAINVYGESGEPYRYSPGYYSYPKDIGAMKNLIKKTCRAFDISFDDMDGIKIPYILPLTGHRFITISQKSENPVLSIHGNDAIVYAPSLEDFLENEVFKKPTDQEKLKGVQVNFWIS